MLLYAMTLYLTCSKCRIFFIKLLSDLFRKRNVFSFKTTKTRKHNEVYSLKYTATGKQLVKRHGRWHNDILTRKRNTVYNSSFCYGRFGRDNGLANGEYARQPRDSSYHLTHIFVYSNQASATAFIHFLQFMFYCDYFSRTKITSETEVGRYA